MQTREIAGLCLIPTAFFFRKFLPMLSSIRLLSVGLLCSSVKSRAVFRKVDKS